MFWTELLFSRLPIDSDKFGQQMVARLSLLFLVWLTGLVAYALDGLTLPFVFDLRVYTMLFFMGIMVLFGSHMIQRSLHDVVLSFRPLLKLDDSEFLRFSERVERYSYSFIPCLLIAVVLAITTSDLPAGVQTAFAGGLRLHEIWDLALVLFLNLLSATAVWFGVSIWLTIFFISKQPLEVELSAKTIEQFRGLTMLALYFSLFYFLANLVGMTFAVAGGPAMSLLEILTSPSLVFILIGIIGILFPFYNIHNTLLNLKTQELQKIEEAISQMLQRLEETLGKRPGPQSHEQTIAAMGHLLSLQIRKGNVERAPEWPIDVGFLSKLGGLVLIPIIGRMALELLTRYFR
jgi:hypothetical protein